MVEVSAALHSANNMKDRTGHSNTAFAHSLYLAHLTFDDCSIPFGSERPARSLTKSRTEGGSHAGQNVPNKKNIKETLIKRHLPLPTPLLSRSQRTRPTPPLSGRFAHATSSARDTTETHRFGRRPSKSSSRAPSPRPSFVRALYSPLSAAPQSTPAPHSSRTPCDATLARACLQPSEPVSINFSPFFVCFACHSARILHPTPTFHTRRPLSLSLSLTLAPFTSCALSLKSVPPPAFSTALSKPPSHDGKQQQSHIREITRYGAVGRPSGAAAVASPTRLLDLPPCRPCGV